MSFTSYAQNFEDVLLWRALRTVKKGKYIDIGAQDPVLDSVSLAFYQAGWRGLHVEPTPAAAARLRSERPDEVIVEAAVSDRSGPIPFYELGGLSSGRKDVADHHRSAGHEPREILVPTVTLESLFEQVKGEIHWLKIDVEGMEAEVLRSWGTSDRRPWILLIEATYPMSEERTEHLWLDEVRKRGYRDVLFDGLSRWFVHESHSDLAERLDHPANVFDLFTITERHFAAVDLADRLNVLAGADERAGQLEQQEKRLRLEVERLNALDVEMQKIARLLDGNGGGGDPIASESLFAAIRARLVLADEELRRARDFGVQQFFEGQKSRDREISALTDRVGKLLNEASEMRDALAEAHSAAAAAQAEQVEARDAADRAEAERASLEQLHRKSLQRADDMEQRADQLERRASKGEEDHRNALALADRLAEDKAELQAQLEELRAARDSLQALAESQSNAAVEAREAVSSIYASRGTSLAVRLGLVPRRPQLRAPSQLPVETAAGQSTITQAGQAPAREGMRIAVNEVRHVNTLLALHGSALVDALYRLFLKRSADRAGRDHFLARLQQGDSKRDIVLAIADSPEAQAIGTTLEGLSDMRRARARESSWLNRPSRLSLEIDRRLNRLEFTIGEAQNIIVERISRIEDRIDAIAQRPSTRQSQSGEDRLQAKSIRGGLALNGGGGAEEFFAELKDQIQVSSEALSLRK